MEIIETFQSSNNFPRLSHGYHFIKNCLDIHLLKRFYNSIHKCITSIITLIQ